MSNPASNPEIGQTIQCGPVLTNYHDIGTGEAVLMLHGSGPGVSAWANWRLPQARLKSDFRLLLPDLVGFGYTPAPEGNPHNLA
jgi:2-hydroxymuconate-semialdehyde hydrolase